MQNYRVCHCKNDYSIRQLEDSWCLSKWHVLWTACAFISHNFADNSLRPRSSNAEDATGNRQLSCRSESLPVTGARTLSYVFGDVRKLPLQRHSGRRSCDILCLHFWTDISRNEHHGHHGPSKLRVSLWAYVLSGHTIPEAFAWRQAVSAAVSGVFLGARDPNLDSGCLDVYDAASKYPEAALQAKSKPAYVSSIREGEYLGVGKVFVARHPLVTIFGLTFEA